MARTISTHLRLLFPAALVWVTGCGSESTPQDLPADLPLATLRAEGESLYPQTCAMCHDAGENSRLAPALRGAPSIVARDPQEAILSILKGRNNRSAAAPGIMPAQAYLSDREIAAIVTYIRTEYGPHGDAVQPADVARLRAANAR